MAAKGDHHCYQDLDIVQGLEAPDQAGQLAGDVLILGKELCHLWVNQQEGAGRECRQRTPDC